MPRVTRIDSVRFNSVRRSRVKSLPWLLCTGVLSLCRLAPAQAPPPGQEAAIRDVGGAGLIRCIEEPGGYVDRCSHDRSA